MKSKRNADVVQERCVACGECTLVCPKGAVTIENGCYAFVNKEICVGCGICSKNCPVGCINIVERQVDTNEEN